MKEMMKEVYNVWKIQIYSVWDKQMWDCFAHDMSILRYWSLAEFKTHEVNTVLAT